MSQTVRSGRQTDNAQARIDRHQIGNQLAITAFVLVRDKVTFVDQDQINMPNLGGVRPDRLNARERDRLLKVLAPQAGGKDTERRIRPMLEHFIGVLLDQFFDMRQHQDARFGIRLQSLFAKRGDDVALA